MDDDKKKTKGKKAEQKEPVGRAKGGVARKEKLSPERRREIAHAAARARHGIPLKATHKGNFKEEFGFDVECFVLDDEGKTAVISKRGMGVALGISKKGNVRPSGQALQRLLMSDRIAPYVGAELAQKMENPLKFQYALRGVEGAIVETFGHDVTILIDICKAIIDADNDGKLGERQRPIAQQAHVIVNASAKLGIKNLVYALAGYDATRAEIIAAFKDFVRQEAREYEKEFPPLLYEEWYRLYGIQKPKRGRNWKLKYLTLDHVYYPLAKSSGKILELARAAKAKSDERDAKIHQFLSIIGVKALRTHVGRLLGIAESASTQEDYERVVEEKFGRQTFFKGPGF